MKNIIHTRVYTLVGKITTTTTTTTTTTYDDYYDDYYYYYCYYYPATATSTTLATTTETTTTTTTSAPYEYENAVQCLPSSDTTNAHEPTSISQNTTKNVEMKLLTSS